MNGTEIQMNSTEMNPYLYGQLNSDKGERPFNKERHYFQQIVFEQVNIYLQKIKIT